MKLRVLTVTAAALTLVAASTHIVRTEEEDDLETGRAILKNGIEIAIESEGRAIGDEALAPGGLTLGPDDPSVVPGEPSVPQVQLRGGNLQVNDPALDNIQTFAGFRPFVKYTQSETTVAAVGRNIVVSYNNSADQPLALNGGVLTFVHRFLSGFSTSNDGGQTWTSGSIPPAPGSIFTFGDGVVTSDRDGNFYYAGLAANAAGQFTIQVNKSVDSGRTWSAGRIVAVDANGDKEWIAVGPDPVVDRENVYVTWTSFQPTGAQLWLGKSIDGGATWTTRAIFAPTTNPNPNMPQNSLQFSQPVVDRFTGRLYIAFAHFSNADADFLRVLASSDGGATFSFLNFNVPGAVLPSVLPVVQSGHLQDMGSGGIRLGIHAGPATAGRFGLPQYVRASRMVVQPAIAVRNGRIYLAWSNSTSPFFGDPGSGSNILFVRSDNGGATWSNAIQVNPSVADDQQHVLPSLAISESGLSVHVAYYTQHGTSESVDVDLANSHDRGDSFLSDRSLRLSSESFVLPPVVVRLTAAPTPTTNYDRLIQPGYSLGEYLGVTAANGSTYVAWGDARNLVTEPVNPLSPLSGLTHTQQDVRFQKVKAQ
jgi:hypothetical protein